MEENKTQQLSYEELNAKCLEVMNHNRQMVYQLSELQKLVSYKRLDYLFQVLKYSDLIDGETVKNSALEIKDTLFPAEEAEEAPEKK